MARGRQTTFQQLFQIKDLLTCHICCVHLYFFESAFKIFKVVYAQQALTALHTTHDRAFDSPAANSELHTSANLKIQEAL